MDSSKFKTRIAFFGLVCILAFLSLRLALLFDLRSEEFLSLWYPYHGLINETFRTTLYEDHPVSVYQDLLFIRFFGFEPFYWHMVGILLKIINSLLVALIIWKLTLSKKAAIYSGLIFASSVVGLASYVWLSEQAPAIEIIPMLLGFFFWLRSFGERILNYKYLLSVIFFLLAIHGSLGRGVVIVPLAILYDLLLLTQNPQKSIFLNVLLRGGISSLFSLAFIFFTEMTSHTISSADAVTSFFDYLLKYPTQAFLNFLYGIGPLVIGWFTPLWESGGQTNKDTLSLIGGILLTITILAIGVSRIRRKDKSIFLFLLFWIPANYFIGWLLREMYRGVFLPGTSHRYLLIPSIGLVGILGFVLSKFRVRTSIFLLLFILIINVARSIQILTQQLPYQSYKNHKLFWDMVDREVPRKYEGSLIFYFASYEPIMSELAYTQSVPFATRRGINKVNEVPITTQDRELVKILLCKNNLEVKNILDYGITKDGIRLQKNPVPLNNLYVWTYKDNSFINITAEQKEALRQEVDCKI